MSSGSGSAKDFIKSCLDEKGIVRSDVLAQEKDMDCLTDVDDSIEEDIIELKDQVAQIAKRVEDLSALVEQLQGSRLVSPIARSLSSPTAQQEWPVCQTNLAISRSSVSPTPLPSTLREVQVQPSHSSSAMTRTANSIISARSWDRVSMQPCRQIVPSTPASMESSGPV